MLDVNSLSAGESVCAFIRHGEKDDGSFGLTEGGKAEAKRMGRILSALHKPVRVCSSPEGRCMETAVLISDALAGSCCGIQTSPLLGRPGVQVKDEGKYYSLTNQLRCRDIYREWKNGRHWDAMHTPTHIESEIRHFIRESVIRHGITICVSQSGTIACVGFALGVIDYRADDVDWVPFLGGFATEI